MYKLIGTLNVFHADDFYNFWTAHSMISHSTIPNHNINIWIFERWLLIDIGATVKTRLKSLESSGAKGSTKYGRKKNTQRTPKEQQNAKEP